MGKKRKNWKPWNELDEDTKLKIWKKRQKRAKKRIMKMEDKGVYGNKVGRYERELLNTIGGYAQIAEVSNKKVSEKFTTEVNARVADTKARIAKMLEKDKNRTPEEIALANDRQRKAVLRKQRPSQRYGEN